MRKTARRVFLDPSTPSFTSIARTVLITLLILFLAALTLGALYLLSFLILLIIVSIFVAYLFDPLVALIRGPFKARNIGHFMPRPLAIVISYVIVFGVLGIAIAYLAPMIGTQISQFAENLPNYAGFVQNWLDAVNTRYERLMISAEVQTQINDKISSIVSEFAKQTTTIAGGTAINIVTYLPWLLLVPILAFFFLKDASMFSSLFLRCFPEGRWRDRADLLLIDVNKTLAAYTRAQLFSCLLIGSICTLAFTLIGLDYALLLGILAGVLEFIPLLGPLTLGITATLVGGFSEDPWQAFWTALFLIILRLTHDYVTYPRIVREGVHIHPLAVILSVLAGEQIAGVPGVFLSIPIVAILAVLYKHILLHSGKTGLFAEIFRNPKIAEAPGENTGSATDPDLEVSD
ncbi:MAG: AI-2E family transporter [Acidobacteria bacterium]|nr:AI-2E family transporter [Acidobacteriota bacterium]